MQNKYFKSAIISSAIAVTTGVLLFGINATFGAPTYQPPGADVSPTFTGLNVTGNITNSSGEVTINDTDGLSVSNGNLSVSGTGYFDKLAITKEINAGGAIWAQDGIDATQGSGTVSAKTITASTSVSATSVATGGLEVTGDIKNSYNKPVTINDTEGLKIAAGPLDVANSIKNTAGVLPLKIDDSLDVTGSISNSAGDVTINDNLKINNELNVVQNAVFSDEVEMSGPLILRGNTQIWDDGNGYVFSVATPMEVAGMISNPDGTNPVTINDAEGLKITQTGGGAGSKTALNLTAGNDASYYGNNQITFGYNGNSQYMHSLKSRHNDNGKAGNALDFYVWDKGVDAVGTLGTKQVMTLDGNGNVGIGTNAPAYNLDVKGTINSTGKITAAGGVGKVYMVASIPVQVSNPAGTATASASCGTAKLLSCSGVLSGWGYINGAKPNDVGASCTVWGKDTDLTSKLTAYAMCWDPNL